MQQKSFALFIFCLCSLPMGVWAAGLLADEQGPTAPEAVATVTANEDFLLPSYVAPSPMSEDMSPVPSEVDILNEIFGSPDPVATANKQVAAVAAAPTPKTFSPRTNVQKQEEQPLLTPLPALPVIHTETVIEPKKNAFKPVGTADEFLVTAALSSSDTLNKLREMRITFYPDQYAFSAQALKWVKSFARRVVNDPRLLAEIRISDQKPQIQRKRLNVLLQILKEEGVSQHQIRLYKTNRGENSILMGYAYNPDFTRMEGIKNGQEGGQKTIEW